MSAAEAKKYANEAQRTGHEIDKLNYIAKAIFELADALESLERKVDGKK